MDHYNQKSHEKWPSFLPPSGLMAGRYAACMAGRYAAWFQGRYAANELT